MYMERQNIQKHIDAAKGAMGIDALAAQGDTQLSGKKIELQAKLDKLWLVMGETVLPGVISILEKLNPMLEKMVGFMREHGTLTKLLVGAFAGLSIIAVVAGGVALIGVAIGGIQLVLGSGAVVMAVRALSVGISLFSRALLMNPIGIAIGLLVVAGYLLYKNWADIKIGLVAIWDTLKSGFHTFIHWYLNGWQTMFNFLIIGINKLLPKAMELSKLTFADDYAKKNGVESVRTAQQGVQVNVHNTVDGHGISSMVTRYQGKWADRAQNGSSGHDGRMAAVSPTLAAAGVF
jgi:hypothetical protein